MQPTSKTLPAFDDDTDLAEISHDEFFKTQPSNGSKSSQSLKKSTSSGVDRFKPEVGHEDVRCAYGEARDQPASSTSLVRYPPVNIRFGPAHKKLTSMANNRTEAKPRNEAADQPARRLNNSVGAPAAASAAPQPQAMHCWKTQHEDIQRELEELRSHFQDLIKKEKARESATNALRRKRNDLVQQDAAARREVTVVKNEADELRSELARVKEERDRGRPLMPT